MNTTGPLWQYMAYNLGITSPKNGRWLFAIVEELNGDVNPFKPLIQQLAEHYGASGPVNGSWIQALAEELGVEASPGQPILEAIALNGLAPRVKGVLYGGIWNDDGVWMDEGVWTE